MSDYLDKLNTEQRSVVDAKGHCLVIACPGSGKTSTAAAKAASLLAAGHRVVAVTFTKDAALELRERIIKLAGNEHAARLLVGTFHSICLFLSFPQKAKQFGREILTDVTTPFDEEWKLVETGVQFSYVGRALRESGLTMKTTEALAIIEQAKEAGSLDHLDEDLQRMVEAYTELMTRSGKIDFQDIILKTNRALKDGSLTALQADHLLVDEFQDTDKAQYEWIQHHANAGVTVTAVGDDDQSIYGFRRALGYDAMDRFAHEFGANRILLGTNYRCHSEILGAAELLINHNTERIEKRLLAHKGDGGVVSWEAFTDSAREAAAVAEEGYLALAEGISFAAIAHTNRELIELQKALVLRDIPFRKADGKSIFDYPEVQTYSALLNTLIRPAANSLDLVLAWTGMSETDIKTIYGLFGSTVRMGSLNDFSNIKISPDAVKTWRAFAKRYNEWTHLLDQEAFSLLNMGVHEWMLETIQKPNSEHLLQIASSLFEPSHGKSLAKHLSDLRLAEMNAKREEKEAAQKGAAAPNVVWLLTAHGSKGLEFDRVWIVGVQNGKFPSDKSSLEEERRLMFVAMTRAKNVLVVSATKEKKPSVFVYESGLLEPPKRGA